MGRLRISHVTSSFVVLASVLLAATPASATPISKRLCVRALLDFDQSNANQDSDEGWTSDVPFTWAARGVKIRVWNTNLSRWAYTGYTGTDACASFTADTRHWFIVYIHPEGQLTRSGRTNTWDVVDEHNHHHVAQVIWTPSSDASPTKEWVDWNNTKNHSQRYRNIWMVMMRGFNAYHAKMDGVHLTGRYRPDLYEDEGGSYNDGIIDVKLLAWDNKKIIAHEFGHAVLEAKAGLPPVNYGYSNGFCGEGFVFCDDNPDGWSSFERCAEFSHASIVEGFAEFYASRMFSSISSSAGAHQCGSIELEDSGYRAFCDNPPSFPMEAGATHPCDWAGFFWHLRQNSILNMDDQLLILEDSAPQQWHQNDSAIWPDLLDAVEARFPNELNAFVAAGATYGVDNH